MPPIIEVTNLSKQYRLGTIGTGTVSHDLNRWWHQVRGKEDPYLKIGQANSRAQKGDNEYVWSLKDINFTVNAGEVLGIIGKNGAGKSTLLKILSKVTAPTTGTIKMRGRVASLLEVGTGFHPELTGRENVFLNGAILGMTKSEIKSKFDEIVDFSGVEKYIDTPVKRYSSGMYVRLAFAVAAHLEPEILIVDEVLAVGDAEFQKKCLGKMKDVSVNEGRTVLFVSHNMLAVRSLCNMSMLLEAGSSIAYDSSNIIIANYLHKNQKLKSVYISEKNNPIIKKVSTGSNTIFYKNLLTVNIEVDNLKLDIDGDALEIFFTNSDDVILFTSIFVIKNISNRFSFTVPSHTFNTGIYKLAVGISYKFSLWKEKVDDVISIEVQEENRDIAYMGRWEGIVRPNINWTVYND